MSIETLYNVVSTVYVMMNDRGYEAQPKLDKKAFIDKFKDIYSNEKEMVFKKIDELVLVFKRDNKKIIVYFHPLSIKLCQNDMKYIVKYFNDNKGDELILISNSQLSPKVLTILDMLGKKSQYFNERELYLKYVDHQLVPKHSKVDEKTKKKLDKEFNTKMFPLIYVTDPVCKYFDFQVGDILKIERPRSDGNFDLCFRLVAYPLHEKPDKK